MILTGLRLVSLVVLTLQIALYLPHLADPTFLTLATTLGVLLAYALRSVRPTVALAIALALGFVLKAGVLTAIVALSGNGASPLDALPLWIDRQWTISLPGFYLGWLSTALVLTDRRFALWERLTNAALLTALFWAQGAFKLTLYPHPLALAIVLGIYVALEATILVVASRDPKANVSVAVGKSNGRRKAALTLAAVVLTFAAAGALWSLFVRYEEGSTAAGGGLMKPNLFQFDFSQFVKLESEITMGDDLVLLYREEGHPQRRYLRRFVLSQYTDDAGFTVRNQSANVEEFVPPVGKKILQFPTASQIAERVSVQQQYYLVNLDPASLLALNAPRKVVPFQQWDRSSFVSAYQVDSLVSTNPLWEMDSVSDFGLTESELAFYTDYGRDSKIQDLARSITNGSTTAFEKINDIERYLKENYFYSLKPGTAPTGNQLQYFLFDSKKGYCSYFAFSMTLMLRSLGIPSRVVVGFFTNPQDGMLNFYPVRAFQAHAWVEVSFGKLGWIEFDPTSQNVAPGEDFQFPQGTDANDLARMISEILQAELVPATDTQEQNPPAAQSSGIWQSGIALLRHYGWTFAVATILVLAAAWRMRFRWARWTTADPRARAKISWNELRSLDSLARIPWRRGETAVEYAARVGSENLASFAAHYDRSRYAPSFAEADERESRRRALAAIQERIAGLRGWRKLAAFWFPSGGGKSS